MAVCINTRCGRDVPDGAPFCPWCGRKQEKAPRGRKSRGNGIGSVYRLKTGKYAAVKTVGWQVDPVPEGSPPGTIPKRRRLTVSRQYATKKEALAALPFLSAADRKPLAKTATQQKRTTITLKELYDQWEPTHGRGRSTMNCYRAGFKIFEPLWTVPMEDIDVDDLQGCMDDADAGRRTLENARTALNLVYKYGIPRDCIPKDRNLAKYLSITGAEAGLKKPGLSDSELQLISKAAADGDAFAWIVICHCYLGFRPSALLGLTAEDYDAAHRAFVGGIKTRAGIGRTVTVSPKIQSYVDRLLTAAGSGYIFGEAGKRMSIKKYRTGFYDLLDRLGIQNPVDEAGRHRLTPHSCRHTFATLMKRVQGSDTDKLALIGHTSTDQLREYQDVSFADLKAITDQL